MSQVSPNGSLPYGWVAEVSKKHPDKVYYFNLNTGEAKWEMPEPDPPRVLSDDEVKRKSSIMNITEPHTSPAEYKNKVGQDLHSPQNTEQGPKPAIVAPVQQKDNPTSEIQKKRKRLEEECVPSAIADTPQISNLKKENVKKKRISPLNKPIDQGKVVPSTSTSHSPGPSTSHSPGPSTSHDSTKDVEMQDVSLNILDNLQEKKETVLDTYACYYIVVDTNVLIRELHLISELKDTPLDGCGPPHIFIPWVVIEELDTLKKHSRGIKASVCEAIRYLNSVLGKHSRFHGQSPAEAEEWSKTYSKCNDDRILECCLALQDKYIKNNMPSEKVILLTNDKNLINKARIHKVNVHDFDSLMQKVKPDTTFNYQEIKNKKKEVANKDSTVSLSSAQEIFLQNKREACKRKVDAAMVNARQRLKDVLSTFFSKEMFKAYGEMWLSFEVNSSLLPGLLKGIIKYWGAVFRLFFVEKDKRNFELLLEKVSRPEGFCFGDKDECLIILSAIEEVFGEIQKRQPNLKVPIEQIHQYRLACVSAFNDYSEAERAIRMEEEKCVNDLLNENWNAIYNLCGMVLDYYNVPHDIDYIKPPRPHRDIQIRILLTTLHPAVQLIKNLFKRIYLAVKECKPFHKMNKKLAKALLEFIPSVKFYVTYDVWPTYPFFNEKALQRFFTSPQNREKIEIGIKQIEKFYNKLDEAVTAMLQCRHLKGKSPTPETKDKNPTSETMIVD